MRLNGVLHILIVKWHFFLQLMRSLFYKHVTLIICGSHVAIIVIATAMEVCLKNSIVVFCIQNHFMSVLGALAWSGCLHMPLTIIFVLDVLNTGRCFGYKGCYGRIEHGKVHKPWGSYQMHSVISPITMCRAWGDTLGSKGHLKHVKHGVTCRPLGAHRVCYMLCLVRMCWLWEDT